MPLDPLDDLDDESLVRYLSGETSLEETRAIERWAAERPERAQRLEVLSRGWEAARGLSKRGDVDRGWEAMAARLEEVDTAANPARPTRVLRMVPTPARRSRWFVAAWAAGIALVAGAGALLLRGALGTPAAQTGVLREIATRPGQRADVYLGDGTHVMLGAASRLWFPRTFGASRDVRLQGEAHFDVAHDERRPFTVHAGRAVARDIGTGFTVRAYADTEDVVVAVADGAVMLAPARTPEDGVLLRRADVGRLSPDGQVAVARAADLDPYVAWTAGRLVFRQTPVAEAVARLSRWYGAEIRLGDSALAREALTATLGDEPIASALELVAGALDARIEWRGSSSAILYTHHTR